MYKYLANTVFTGKKLVHLTSCHSTNNYAREIAQKKDDFEGTIIITDHQTAGKGQRGNQWESAPGENLTFSVIYYPTFLNSSESFYLNIITSLAIIDALKDFGFQPLIKWPNDIYCSNKKISGILIENIMERDQIKKSIIGVGLNVNQDSFSYESAASMFSISNRKYHLNNIFEKIVTLLEQHYLKLRSGNRDNLMILYHKYLLGLNESREFEVNGEKMKGTIVGIEGSGRLKVEITGKTQYFSFKEIKFLF